MAKQTPKKTTINKKPMIAPVMEHKCECGRDCSCGCHRHGTAHIIKHIIVWAIIFALGLACGKMMNCGHHGKKMYRQMHPVFTDGCLDMASIDCPKMAEEIVAADVNADNCISIEEFKAWKKANKPDMRNGQRGIRGFRGPKKSK